MNYPDLTPWYHHNLNPIALQLGEFILPWYWIVYVLGWVWCAFLLTGFKSSSADHVPSSLGIAKMDFLLWGWINLLLGARIFYVLFYNPFHYLRFPSEVVAIWNGGMSFHGGLLGITLTALWISKKHRVSIFALTDPIAVGIPWILFLGRLANFANGELPGRITGAPWAVVFPPPYHLAPRHPSQIYEALCEGVLLGLVMLGSRKKFQRQPGLASLYFVGLYAATRFFVEFTREPDPQIGLLRGLSLGQWLSLAMMTVAVLAANKHKTPSIDNNSLGP